MWEVWEDLPACCWPFLQTHFDLFPTLCKKLVWILHQDEKMVIWWLMKWARTTGHFWTPSFLQEKTVLHLHLRMKVTWASIPCGTERTSQHRQQGPYLHNNLVCQCSLNLPALTGVQLQCYSFWYLNVIKFIATWVLCQLSPFPWMIFLSISLISPPNSLLLVSSWLVLSLQPKLSLLQWGYPYMSVYFKPFVIFGCSLL